MNFTKSVWRKKKLKTADYSKGCNRCAHRFQVQQIDRFLQMSLWVWRRRTGHSSVWSVKAPRWTNPAFLGWFDEMRDGGVQSWVSSNVCVWFVRCPNKELLPSTEEGTNGDVLVGAQTPRSCCYIALDNGEKTRHADVTLLVFRTAFLSRRTWS